MNTFEISFIFVRQDKIEASLRQQIIACISYLFFPPLKVVFYLRQNLIEKPRFLWITWRQIITTHTLRASKHFSQKACNSKYTIFGMFYQTNLSEGKDFSISLLLLSILPIKHSLFLKEDSRARYSQLKPNPASLPSTLASCSHLSLSQCITVLGSPVSLPSWTQCSDLILSLYFEHLCILITSQSETLHSTCRYVFAEWIN